MARGGPPVSDTVSVTRSTRYLNEQRVREEECTPVRHPSRIRRRIFLGRKLDRIGDEVRLRGGEENSLDERNSVKLRRNNFSHPRPSSSAPLILTRRGVKFVTKLGGRGDGKFNGLEEETRLRGRQVCELFNARVEFVVVTALQTARH